LPLLYDLRLECGRTIPGYGDLDLPTRFGEHHGDVGGPRLLADVGDYLELLRNETWVRRDSSMSEETIVDEVRALMIERHPDWSGQEWIEQGVGCLCAEHLA